MFVSGCLWWGLRFEKDTAEIRSQCAAMPSIGVSLYSAGWMSFFYYVWYHTSVDLVVFYDRPVAVVNVGASRMYIHTFSCIFELHIKDKVTGPVAVMAPRNRSVNRNAIL